MRKCKDDIYFHDSHVVAYANAIASRVFLELSILYHTWSAVYILNAFGVGLFFKASVIS